MLVFAFTYHQVMAPFVDFLFSFGKQDHPKDFHFSGMYDETHLIDDQPSLNLPDLGRSGTDFEMCYNLKSVESSIHQEHFPWSVRQLAVHHSFDVITGKTFWTIIKGDELIKRRIKAATDPSSHPDLDLSTPLQSFLVTLTVHLIIFDWCREQWRWYISYLEELQEITTRRALTMSFDRPTTRPSDSPPPRAATAPPLGKLKRAVTKVIKRAASATGTLPPPIPLQPIPQLGPPPPDFEPDLENTESFSFSNLQDVQSYEEKARELLLVVRSNIKIVTSIKDYYMELVGSPDFPDDIKVGSTRKIKNFEKTVLSIVNDLEMQHSRASMLLSTLTNRKGLVRIICGKFVFANSIQLNGVLEYRSMEASKRFAEKAEASTMEMHTMTEEMTALTQKTKQETVSMRIITLVTLFFLPGTFISVCLFSLTYFVRFHFLSPSPSVLANTEQQTIMSTDIVQYSKIPNSNDYEEEYSSAALKRYVMITLPLMALTFLAWWILYFWVETKQRVEALTAKIKRSKSVNIV